jgi:hypothetical protein
VPVSAPPRDAGARIAAWLELVDLGLLMAYESLLAVTGDAGAARRALCDRLCREDEERRGAKLRMLNGLARPA